jgi:hypothetical protein
MDSEDATRIRKSAGLNLCLRRAAAARGLFELSSFSAGSLVLDAESAARIDRAGTATGDAQDGPQGRSRAGHMIRQARGPRLRERAGVIEPDSSWAPASPQRVPQSTRRASMPGRRCVL